MTGIVERAYEIARSGSFGKIEDIRRVLSREGYDGIDGHLDSPSLRKELNSALRLSRRTQQTEVTSRGKPR